jgi:hypothetical protein
MKVLFLDFDGVLNSKQHFLSIMDKKKPAADTLSDADLFHMKQSVNYNNMWVLGYILKQVPDLKIVISSAWGAQFSLPQFKELFKIFRLPSSRLIGITPRKFSSSRNMEIMWWLEDQKDVEAWIAVDDHPIFYLEDKKNFANQYLTDSWIGLNMQDAFKIIKHFNPEYHQPLILI